MRTVRFRHRPSDPWFDDDGRMDKQNVGRLEHAVRRADPANVTAAATTWTAQRREYMNLLQKKREEFWKEKIDAEHSNPRQLWRSIDMLMGRGLVDTLQPPPTSTQARCIASLTRRWPAPVHPPVMLLHHGSQLPLWAVFCVFSVRCRSSMSWQQFEL